MNRSVNPRFFGFFLVGLLAFSVCLNAQKAPGSGSVAGSAGASAGTGIGTTNGSLSGSRGTFGNTTNTTNNGGFDQSRPIFLSGNVMFDDGSSPNNDIRIERTCNGSTRLESHTDSKGRFSFQLGGEAGISDASDASSDSFGNSTRNSVSGQNQLGNSTRSSGSFGGPNLLGCELKAAYPGYVSEVIDLSTRHSLDDPKVGTIVLRHLGNVKGTTISITTAQAPKSAQKSFEKGNQLVLKGKFEEAGQRFESATADDKNFAAAWFALGLVERRLNKPDEAKKSFLAAMAADNHFVSPFDQMALISAEQGQWQDAAQYSKQATDLNPVEFPSSFWYNALANYNLKNNAEAEKSARALLKLDSRHHYPQAETMLAEFAATRGELDDAISHLKAYLAEVPNAKNVDNVKAQIARVEQIRATQAKNMPTAPSAQQDK